MEDLFGGECNMFNPAATEDNDEDQPAGSHTLLQRAQLSSRRPSAVSSYGRSGSQRRQFGDVDAASS